MKKGNLIVAFLFACLFVIMPFKAKAITSPALTHLEVETSGGQGNFNLSSGRKSFTFSLTSPYDYANIIAEAADPSYQITGAGHVECTEGTNTISVVVTDPSDGSSETYTINLNFAKKTSTSSSLSNPKTSIDEDEEVETTGKKVDVKNPETGAFLNFGILAMISLMAIITIKKLSNDRKFYRI